MVSEESEDQGELIPFSVRVSEDMKAKIDEIALFENMRPSVQARRMLLNEIRKYERMPQFKTFRAGLKRIKK